MTDPTVSRNATVSLKPCPFCGGPARCEWYRVNVIKTYTPGCESCGFWMYPEHWNEPWTELQAVEIWNRRVNE